MFSSKNLAQAISPYKSGLITGANVKYVIKPDLWQATKEKDAACSKRFETTTETAVRYSHRLDHKKGRLVDNSIHLSNIHHIRRAQHFIYIESQYFLSSSFMWATDRHVKCGNMIAAEVRPADQYCISLSLVPDAPPESHILASWLATDFLEDL